MPVDSVGTLSVAAVVTAEVSGDSVCGFSRSHWHPDRHKAKTVSSKIVFFIFCPPPFMLTKTDNHVMDLFEVGSDVGIEFRDVLNIVESGGGAQNL